LLKGLRQQGRTNGLGRLATAKLNQSAPPTPWQWRARKKVTGKIKDVLEVVFQADALHHEGNHPLHAFFIDANRAANTHIALRIFGERHSDHPIL